MINLYGVEDWADLLNAMLLRFIDGLSQIDRHPHLTHALVTGLCLQARHD